MKLLLPILCCCVLAAADTGVNPDGEVPTLPQIYSGLTRVYRRLLHKIAPDQLQISDALDIRPRHGMLAGPVVQSAYNGIFDGIEKHTFSYKHSLINPEQKGVDGHGMFMKNTASEVIVTYHYGDTVKVHMITEGGIHKTLLLGNPLDRHHHDAKVVIVLPKSTYATFESLSEDKATFITYFAVPSMDPATQHYFSLKQMETKFQTFAELFHELAKPGVHHEEHHEEPHHHDEPHHDDHGSHH